MMTVPNDPSREVYASRMSMPLPAVFSRSLVMVGDVEGKIRLGLQFGGHLIGDTEVQTGRRPSRCECATSPRRLLLLPAASLPNPVNNTPGADGAGVP